MMGNEKATDKALGMPYLWQEVDKRKRERMGMPL